MNIPRFFIDRPVFATVISIMIVLIGAISFLRLPVASYPEIVPPTVQVTASYPGANAVTVAETVAAPLEQQVNGVENMLYMMSQSTNDGSMALTVTFRLGANLDMAQVLTQNRVSLAVPQLPEEVRRTGVSTKKRSPAFTLAVNLVSPNGRYDQLYLSNFALLQVKDVLARLPGVGDVSFLGARDYSMRVWMDPDKMALLGLIPSDISKAVQEHNVQVAAGVLGQAPSVPGTDFEITINTKGRLLTPEEFGEIVVKEGKAGEIVRIRDVARVEIGAKDYGVNCTLDGMPSVALAVFQQPGSNAIETADAVSHAMADMVHRKVFPEGLEYKIVYDTTVFIEESIKAVEHTFIEAVILVVLVVLVFLQTWRATLIPLLAVPVSIVGTFGVMALLGFSVNNISLFGLILAIGIVVDDAIIVVENVERNLALGFSPLEATRKAMDEVSGALVAVALVLTAVFVPTAFISGISGQFYQQFAVTVAVSTIISAFNSLTLSPALAAILLKPHRHAEGHQAGDERSHSGPEDGREDLLTRALNFTLGWFFRGFNKFFDVASEKYAGAIRALLKVSLVVVGIYLGLLMATYFGFRIVPTGFIPPQDKGYLIVNGQLPPGASLERSEQLAKPMDEICRSTPGVAHTIALPGYSFVTGANAPNAVSIIVILEPFEERHSPELSADAIQEQIQGEMMGIKAAQIGVFGAPPVDGMGAVGGFKMMVQDRGNVGLQDLQVATQDLVRRANASPVIDGAFSSFQNDVPQLFVEIDREQAKTMRVPLANIFDTLQSYLGSSYLNDVTLYGRSFQVNSRADAAFRMLPEDIGRLKTRNSDGQMVPLAAVIDVQEVTGPDKVIRYNLFPAADVNGMEAPGRSSGEAIAEMERLAAGMPRAMGYEWTDLTYQQILAGNTAILVFPMAVLFVFLTLSAQYESWSLPLAIILIVPMCLLSSILGIWLAGMDNNIFTQIGFVVLVGLAAKNAILIVEFAKQLEDEKGLSPTEAAVEACRLRLRPILMTSLAFILGVVPLMLSAGAGAEMRVALGVGVFSGMLGVTFFGIFLTPVFYQIIRHFSVRNRKTPTPAKSDSESVSAPASAK